MDRESADVRFESHREGKRLISGVIGGKADYVHSDGPDNAAANDRRDKSQAELIIALGGLPYAGSTNSPVTYGTNVSEEEFIESVVAWIADFKTVLTNVQRTAKATQGERDTLRAQRDAVREFLGTGERDLGMTSW